ncbi:hypothetical protein OAT01_11095 [Pseudomonadales bacterium]|nr:hypothetical protein [Pseudomonadales bacterium]
MISQKHAMVVATKRPCMGEYFLDDIQINDDSDNAHLHSKQRTKADIEVPHYFESLRLGGGAIRQLS